MTLSELIETLEEMQQEAGGCDPDVRIAFQPNHPLEYAISDARMVDGDDGPTVFLAEDGQLGYLDDDATRELGWDR